VVLPGVQLPEDSADARTILPRQDEAVLGYVAVGHIFVDKLDVGKALLACANFILAFYDQDTAMPEHAGGFLRRCKVEV